MNAGTGEKPLALPAQPRLHPLSPPCEAFGMNKELQTLFASNSLTGDSQRTLRYSFAHACAERVRHRLEDARAIELLDVLKAYVEGRADEAALAQAADEAAVVANRHRGSSSIDGSQHSAVSGTYAVAKALAGKALDAADYAAYSTVYGYGGYAVSDPDAFAPEHAWQVSTLQRLLREAQAAESALATT